MQQTIYLRKGRDLMYFFHVPAVASPTEAPGEKITEENRIKEDNIPQEKISEEQIPEDKSTRDNPDNRGTPVTLAIYTQDLVREAIVSGSVNNLCNNLHLWIEKIRLFLNYADAGVETLNNIVNVTRENLAQAAGLQLTPEVNKAPLTLPASSFKLFWDLIRTPEFQQFFGRMLAQLLQPPRVEGSG